MSVQKNHIQAATDRAERQQTLENAQRMAAIIANSDDAIISKTPEGKVTSWNPAAARMYGYSSHEIIGRSIDVIIPADRPDEMNDILAQIRSGQHVDHFETVRVRKDGTAVRVSLSVSPIRDENDEIVGASTLARDITEQTPSFESARAMIESSLDALVAISPDGKITDRNEATAKVTGIPEKI